MQLKRTEFLALLNEVSIGLSSKEGIEQSNCFVFSGPHLMTFNDQILARVANPLGFDVVVNADDLRGLVSKMPDDVIDVEMKGGELIVRGQRREAGIACTAEMLLPVNAVPKAGGWIALAEGTLSAMLQASRMCSNDEVQPLTTFVHVTPNRIEGCDNFRLFRYTGKTGFADEVLVPASTVAAIGKMDVKRVDIGKGWVHFRTATRMEISARCSHEKYHDGLDALLKMAGGERVSLPGNLAEMVERAEIMSTGGYDAKVLVEVEKGTLTLTARKDQGYYREEKRVKYDGRPLAFRVNPKFLVEVLGRTRDVVVDKTKMLLEIDNVQVVVALEMPQVEKPAAKAKTEEEESR